MFSFLTILVTEHEVSDQLTPPPPRPGITPKIPKLVSTSMCKPLIGLFNKSLEQEKSRGNLWNFKLNIMEYMTTS